MNEQAKGIVMTDAPPERWCTTCSRAPEPGDCWSALVFTQSAERCVVLVLCPDCIDVLEDVVYRELVRVQTELKHARLRRARARVRRGKVEAWPKKEGVR